MEIKPYEKFAFEDGNVGIDKVTVSYLQNSDSSGDDGEENVQKLILTTRNNGVARFINIKTDSWSIDNADELIQIIKDFEKRAELCGGKC
jgi:hypothetical protein